ncbi:MAG: hypothetical protein HOQ12_07530 [Gemmatimonadaceae bacterium]|nr:hypothetical protein [Gemmatimonadaceae bacterium]
MSNESEPRTTGGTGAGTTEALPVEELRALEAKATPGPWAWEARGVWTEHPDGMGGPILDEPHPRDAATGTLGYVGDSYPRGINHPSENMQLIAEMRNALPGLLDEIVRLRSALSESERRERELETRVRQWGENLAEALGRRSPTMEEVVGASIAAIHERDEALRESERREREAGEVLGDVRRVLAEIGPEDVNETAHRLIGRAEGRLDRASLILVGRAASSVGAGVPDTHRSTTTGA